MTNTEQVGKRVGDVRNQGCTIELVTTRSVFSAGGLLTGIVILRATQPVISGTLKVWLQGVESTARNNKPQRRISREQTMFFAREKLITGVEPPCKARERISLLWNTFLGRTKKRTIVPGEHIYPFAIPLPGSLPPSYKGSAGEIEYILGARLNSSLRRTRTIKQHVLVTSAGHNKEAKPAVVRYPSDTSEQKEATLTAELALYDTVLEAGSSVMGHFKLSAPSGSRPKSVTICLDLCERVRGSHGATVHRKTADEFVFENPTLHAGTAEGDFMLSVPSDAPPTVEAARISVSWTVRLRADAESPIDLGCPIVILGAGSCSGG